MPKKILLAVIIVVIGLLIVLNLDILPRQDATPSTSTPNTKIPPQYPTRTRAEAVPKDVVKGTPENDPHPPLMNSDEWEKPVPVDTPITTTGGEDSAYVTWDGSTLYFFFTPDVRVPVEKQILDNVTGIYVSHYGSDGYWSEPQRVWLDDPGKLSMEGAEVIQGDVMWFVSAREGYTDLNHFTARLVDGKWVDWEYVGDQFPKDYQVGEVHLMPDMKTLYFHSARNGTIGGLDIWVTHLVDGSWSEPVNIAAVNSPVDEGWPFLTPDGEEMWITRWHSGTPALYRSRCIDGNWTSPELIVYQFAGESSLDEDGNLYFTHHYYKDGEMIEGDIYMAKRRDTLTPLDTEVIPSRGFTMEILPMPSANGTIEASYDLALDTAELVPIWGRPSSFYNLASDLSGPWGEEFVTKFIRGKGLTPVVNVNFMAADMTLDTSPGLEGTTLSTPAWREAYKNAVLDVVRASRPLYLSIGNEVNRWYEKYGLDGPNGFRNYVSLYEETYDAVKKLSPETKVYCVFAREIVDEYREADMSVMGLFNPETMDMLVITSYPFAVNGIKAPADMPSDYYLKAAQMMPGKLFGFSELGWPSLDALGGEAAQAGFLRMAADTLTVSQGVPLRTLGWCWLHDQPGGDASGLITLNGLEKQAYQVWREISKK